MRIVVKYFSAMRDITGRQYEEVSFSESIKLSEFLQWFFDKYPKARVFREELLVLVNGRAVSEDYVVKDGDEIAIMPPVSGGGGVVLEKINIDEEIKKVIEKTAPLGGGGVVVFVGYVKGLVDGSVVERLEYEAYEPYATMKINEIEKWALEQDGVLDIRVYHRVGTLKPGDTTIYVIASAINRDVAFRVAKEVLERVKHEVPIFKLEKRDDGEYWVIGDGKRVPRGVKNPQF
ncbi:MAG: MoaD family protein [Pyrobaculum sp.]